MLVYFNQGDKYNRITLAKVYFDESKSIKELVKKFIRIKESIDENNSFSLSEYVFELTYREKFKTFSFESYKESKDFWGDNRLETKFKEFFDLGFESKFEEPDTSLIKDLVGWTFLNAFTHADISDRRFTFEKDGVIKQYTLSSSRNGIKRDYHFTSNNVDYYKSKDHIFGSEYKGDIYALSQILRGTILDISLSIDVIFIKTDKGEVTYREGKYKSGITFSKEKKIFKCPYDEIEEEYYVVNNTVEKANSLSHQETRTYCFTLNPYTSQEWLRDNKVGMHFSIINKQNKKSIFDIYSVDKEFMNNGLYHKSDDMHKEIEKIIFEINKDKNFDFLKQFIYEPFPDFVKKYKDRNVPPPTKEELQAIEDKNLKSKKELEVKKKKYIFDYDSGRDIFSYGYDLKKDIPGHKKEFVCGDWRCENVYIFSSLENKADYFLDDLYHCEDRRSAIKLVGFRLYNEKEGFFTNIKINSVHDTKKWSESLFIKKVSKRKHKFDSTYYSLQSFLSD